MSDKNTNWEPDIKKQFELIKNIKDIKETLKEDADRRKIDGFNPSDLLRK